MRLSNSSSSEARRCVSRITSVEALSCVPLNLRLETIEELDDFAIFLTQRVKARVSPNQLANGCFIFGKLC